MELQDILIARVGALESRITALEMRVAAGEGGPAPKVKRKKDLTLEQRQEIRKRLVAGQERKRKEREVAAAAEAKKANK